MTTKRDTYFGRYLVYGVIALFALMTSLSFYISGVVSQTFDPSTSPTGWIWNGYQFAGSSDTIGLGWTSMNCLNDFDNDGQLEYRCDPTKPYGLVVSVGGPDSDGNGTPDLDGDTDFLQGCAWSSAYGWVCFNSGDAPTYQCDTDTNASDGGPYPECAVLSHQGVQINDYPAGLGSDAFFYYLDSPTWDGSSWPAPTDTQRAAITSLYDGAAPEESYIGFPFRVHASTTNGLISGCFGCDSTDGTCNACLNTSSQLEDPATNPGPNLLCWDCSSCTVSVDGGSCSNNRDRNTCPASSCAGGCTDFTGVIVNEYESEKYEMCGWGYHSYYYASGDASYITLLSQSSSVDTNFHVRVGSDGIPVIMRNTYDPSSRVELIRCSDTSCTSHTDRVVYDSDFSEVVLGSKPGFNFLNGNKPVFSWGSCVYDYYGGCDNGSARINYTVCSDTLCDSKVKVQVASTGIDEWINDMHVEFNSSGNPIISAYLPQTSTKSVHIYVCDGTGPTGCSGKNQLSRIIASPASYYDVPLVVPSDDLPIIAYSTASQLEFLRCNDVDCNSASGSGVPVSQGLGIPHDHDMILYKGLPLIAYNDYIDLSNLYIRVIHCGDYACDTSNPNYADTLVHTAAAGTVGTLPLSLAIGSNGYPQIVLSEGTSAFMITCQNDFCTSAITEPVTVPSPNYQIYPKLATSLQGNPVFVYAANRTIPLPVIHDLNYGACAASTCGDINKGIGWIAFNSEPRIGDQAYIDVQEGSILSRGSIYSPDVPPIGKYNAAYIIEASGDIVNWFSQNAFSYTNLNNLPNFLTKNGSGVYENVLGKLDYTGITTAIEPGWPAVGSFTNKFGSTMLLNHSDLFSNALGNRVFFYDNDLSQSGGEFISTPNTNGSGIIVVDGDLTISGDITYDATSVSKLREIPSVVWIVNGDVNINSDVSQVSGTFVVLGNGTTACPGNGCGRFSTGSSANQLVINGAVIARQFNFERSYGTGGEPSEKFIPEGRLQANPPSGLSDFSKSVPRFTNIR